MPTFFRIQKPEYYHDSQFWEKGDTSLASDISTLNEWLRSTSDSSRVSVSSDAAPYALTQVSEDDVENGTDFAAPLHLRKQLYIKNILEKHGLRSRLVCEYIRMCANVNGFLASAQIAISQAEKINHQSSIHTGNPIYSFIIVKDGSGVQYIEESDIILNPTHECGKGEKIARIKVVSTISENEHNEIQHVVDSASLVPCPQKMPQCIRHFGDNRTVMQKVISMLKKIFMRVLSLFKIIKQNDDINNATSSFIRCQA